MKLRPVFVCVCALLALVAVATACSGGDGGTSTAVSQAGTAGQPLTLQEYFQRVQALDSRASQRINVIGEGLSTQPSADEQKLSAIRDYLTGLTAIDKDLRDGLQRITPPPEAKAAHQAAIEALTGVVTQAQAMSDTAATVTNPADIIAVLVGPQAKTATDRLTQACQALNQVAAAHSLAIKLSCGQ